MAILIKNPEVERKARELAARRGMTLTGAIDAALEDALAAPVAKARRPTLEEMEAATDRLWEAAGIAGPLRPVTKAEWDEINEIPGFAEDDS
jgi:antitoxin VapB